MSHQNHLFHRHIDKKRTLQTFDKLMLAIAFVYPITGIPQAIEVFSGNVEGVSVVSWLGFLLFVSIFLVYSVIHKIKPMIITYIMWWFVDVSVVAGIILNS